MIIPGKLRLAAIGAASAMAFIALQGQPASAQLFWDWNEGSTREVVSFNPKYGTGQIIVSFGDKRLYYVTQPGQAISYPIAVPREKSRWQGVTSVSQKRENPSWTPTPTMIAENPRLPRWVPGGHPMNPLGVRALYLGSSMYRIHGTDAPWTIGTAASKGCIRLFNEDVLDLYPRVRVGAKVTVTYQTFTTSGSVGTTASASKSQGGGLFDMFGSDDEPEKAKRPRAKRKTSDKSAAAEKKAVERTETTADASKGAVTAATDTAARK
jgi:lipoprotein-anchoring transpeptidase ErfK/SrfK